MFSLIVALLFVSAKPLQKYFGIFYLSGFFKHKSTRNSKGPSSFNFFDRLRDNVLSQVVDRTEERIAKAIEEEEEKVKAREIDETERRQKMVESLLKFHREDQVSFSSTSFFVDCSKKSWTSFTTKITQNFVKRSSFLG